MANPDFAIDMGKYEVYDSKGRILPASSYFVIKSSDLFAPAALYGYAHLITSGLELGALPHRPDPFTPDERLFLTRLADEAAALADNWMRSPDKKVPD